MTIRQIIPCGLLLGYFMGGAWAFFTSPLPIQLVGAWPFLALGIIGLIGCFKNS